MAGSFAARRRFGSVSHMHDVGGGSGTVREDFQTLDYDIDESTLFQQELQSKPLAYRRRLNLFRWLICMGVGVTTGLLAFLIDVAGENIFAFKFWLAGRAAGGTLSSTGSNAQAWLSGLATVAGLNMCLVASACALVLFVSPIAGGSGIPEVKAYLQGIKVPRMLRTSALVAKAVGVLGSVTGGLIVGKEGPMIHIGSVIAAGVSQGSSKTCNVRTMWLKGFRNDHDKRDFVSAGAAAGVAAAFGAPIGGTLFAMEEAATYWSQPLTWRTFFCALCSTFTLNLLMSAVKEDGHFGALSHPGLITFGAFLPSEANWDLRELPIFAGLGLLGGIFGALFVHLSKRLSTWRGARRCGDATRLAETLGVATLTTVLAFCLPLALPCAAAFDNSTATTPNGTPALTPPNPLVVAMDELLCPEGLHSGLGAMTLASHEHAIKVLFHANPSPSTVNLAISGTYFLFAFWLGILTYGLPIPSGLFVPSIMAGAAYGRFFGELLNLYAPGYSTTPPGNFALIGAAAMLGGISRMTISITVIVLECTTNIIYVLPIALAIMIAKIVGDLFNLGIYDMHIELKRYPMLPEEPAHRRERLQAKHVMSPGIRTVNDLERVGKLLDLLNTTTHHGFPVVATSQLERSVSPSADGATFPGGRPVFQRKPRVLGIILREQLVTILAKKKAHNWMPPASARAGSVDPAPLTSLTLTADDFLRPWFNEMVSHESIRMTPAELDRIIDLRPYVNEAALVTTQNSSLRRVSHLFRALGLRHLLVVESCPTVVGVITRKDLLMGGQEFLLPGAECDPDAPSAPLGGFPTAGGPASGGSGLADAEAGRVPLGGPILEDSPASPFTTLWRNGLAALGLRGSPGASDRSELTARLHVQHGQLDARTPDGPADVAAGSANAHTVTPLRSVLRTPQQRGIRSPDV